MTREQRIKDQIKSVLKAEVMKYVVDRGDLRNVSINYELLDLN